MFIYFHPFNNFLLDSKSKDRSRKEDSKRSDKKRSRTPSKERSSKDSSLKKRTKTVNIQFVLIFHLVFSYAFLL